ncbi:hypothetical protein PV325_006177 [Microctonus aethiopoides]|nr:hypothetical protein PV325_006177 [Microctonus aethiopoides]KAK0096171.1 hypothetical protein PV326_006259 [Microctonus aethiopoides]
MASPTTADKRVNITNTGDVVANHWGKVPLPVLYSSIPTYPYMHISVTNGYIFRPEGFGNSDPIGDPWVRASFRSARGSSPSRSILQLIYVSIVSVHWVTKYHGTSPWTLIAVVTGSQRSKIP